MKRAHIGCSRPATFLVMVFLAAGCGRKGLEVRSPLRALQSVPAPVVAEPVSLTRQDFALNIETGKYRPTGKPVELSWLSEDRLTELYRDYVTELALFRGVSEAAPREATDLYLICRPRLTVRQYVRPSLGGAVLTMGTGLIYTLMGGSAEERHVDLELSMDVLSPSGRPITTYRSCRHSTRQLVTDSEDQLGPLVGTALTRVLDDVADQMARDNDLLMRALSADMSTKGFTPRQGPMRIHVTHPRTIILRTKDMPINGQVIGVDRPVQLTWYLNETRGGTVALTDTDAASVKEFRFVAPVRKGLTKLALSLSAPGEAQEAELVREVVPYLGVAGGEVVPVRKRWAVVVGISKYAHSGGRLKNLRFAHRDAEEFHKFLLSPRGGKFDPAQTLCLTDQRATLEAVRYALHEFLAAADRDDLVVIYFSGHGMRQDDTDNFFILCHDSKVDHMPSTALPTWEIGTALSRFIRAERVVVCADACHAGAIPASSGTKGQQDNAVHQYLRKLALAKQGRLFLTACEANEEGRESHIWGGGHGAFTHFLLRGLGGEADLDRDGTVYAGEIVKYMPSRVEDATGGKQHPKGTGEYDQKLPLSVVPKRK